MYAEDSLGRTSSGRGVLKQAPQILGGVLLLVGAPFHEDEYAWCGILRLS